MKELSRGFSLLELVIVLTLVSIAGAIYINSQASKWKEQDRAALTADYVSDFQQLDRAIRGYVVINGAALTANTLVTISSTTLTGANLLPANFATRNGGTGVSPIGTGYSIALIRSSTDGRVRAVVWENGTASTGRLERIGLPADASGLAGLKGDIAAALARGGYVGAVIAANTQIATGGGSNGWNKSIAAWVTTAPTQASVAVLSGFPDLDPSIPGINPVSGPQYSDCRIAKATCSVAYYEPYCGAAQAVDGVCNAGYTKVGTIPHCGYTTTLFASSPVGTFTLGSTESGNVLSSQDPNLAYKCDAARNPLCLSPPYDSQRNIYTDATIGLNNQEIAHSQGPYLCKVHYTGTDPFASYYPAPITLSGDVEWPQGAGRDAICCR